MFLLWFILLQYTSCFFWENKVYPNWYQPTWRHWCSDYTTVARFCRDFPQTLKRTHSHTHKTNITVNAQWATVWNGERGLKLLTSSKVKQIIFAGSLPNCRSGSFVETLGGQRHCRRHPMSPVRGLIYWNPLGALCWVTGSVDGSWATDTLELLGRSHSIPILILLKRPQRRRCWLKRAKSTKDSADNQLTSFSPHIVHF